MKALHLAATVVHQSIANQRQAGFYTNKLCLSAGPLPASWSILDLLQLNLFNNSISGSLPASYGTNGTWPDIKRLNIADNSLTGPHTTVRSYNSMLSQLLIPVGTLESCCTASPRTMNHTSEV